MPVKWNFLWDFFFFVFVLGEYKGVPQTSVFRNIHSTDHFMSKELSESYKVNIEKTFPTRYSQTKQFQSWNIIKCEIYLVDDICCISIKAVWDRNPNISSRIHLSRLYWSNLWNTLTVLRENLVILSHIKSGVNSRIYRTTRYKDHLLHRPALTKTQKWFLRCKISNP